jgi:hypothetical protein
MAKKFKRNVEEHEKNSKKIENKMIENYIDNL